MPSLFLAWNYCYSWGDVAGYRRSLCHKTSICFVLLLRSLVLLQPQLVMTLAAPKFTMHNVFFFFFIKLDLLITYLWLCWRLPHVQVRLCQCCFILWSYRSCATSVTNACGWTSHCVIACLVPFFLMLQPLEHVHKLKQEFGSQGCGYYRSFLLKNASTVVFPPSRESVCWLCTYVYANGSWGE